MLPAYPSRSAKSSCAGISCNHAVIGAIQATQAVKAITGAGRWLAGRLRRYDGLALAFREFKINQDPHCPKCGRE